MKLPSGGFPRAYLARGAEIAETEQRAITLKQLKEGWS